MKLQAIIKTIRQWFFGPQLFQDFYYQSEFDPDDITTYPTTKDIFDSGRFSPGQRRREYNDMYLEDGAIYNDMDRDWEADA